MQVSTSLQTDNYASTSSLSFLQAGCPSCCPTISIKALHYMILRENVSLRNNCSISVQTTHLIIFTHKSYLRRAVEAVSIQYWLNHDQTLCQVFYQQHVTVKSHNNICSLVRANMTCYCSVVILQITPIISTDQSFMHDQYAKNSC